MDLQVHAAPLVGLAFVVSVVAFGLFLTVAAWVALRS